MSLDLKMFYEKYETRLKTVGLTEEDRKLVQETVN
jgi:hypothetical protein